MGKDARGTTERMASNNLSLFSIFVFSRGGILKSFLWVLQNMIAIGFLCIGRSKEFAADDFAKKNRFWKWTCKLFKENGKYRSTTGRYLGSYNT